MKPQIDLPGSWESMPRTCGDLCGSKVRETQPKFSRLCLERVFFTEILELNNGPLVVQCWIRVKEDFCLGKMKGRLVSSKSRPESHLWNIQRTSSDVIHPSDVIHRQSLSKPVGKSIHKFDQIRLLFISFSFRGLSSLATFMILEYKPAPKGAN